MPQFSLAGLRVKAGDPISAEKWNQLVLEVERLTPRPGRNTRMIQTPAGTIISPLGSKGGGGGTYNYPFKPSASEDGYTFNKGMVAGIVPKIDGKAIDSDPAPSLKIERGDLVYLVCTITGDFAISKVEIQAFKEKPDVNTPLKAYKLLAVAEPISETDFKLVPVVFFNLGFWASNRRPTTGRARFWFYVI